jgi:glyceraldehyde-3-phosphate dehydrogenase/erythrose-4-phosphate dehydrogenase
MELKKEFVEVDFIVDSTPLTKEDQIAISEFIKADKAKKVKPTKKNTKGIKKLQKA